MCVSVLEDFERRLVSHGKIEHRHVDCTAGRATYVFRDLVIKVELINRPGARTPRTQSVSAEKDFLDNLSESSLTPTVVWFEVDCHYEALAMTRVLGYSLDERRFGLIETLEVHCKALINIIRLSSRGIVHGDLAPHNIIFTSDSRVVFIDFGHAYRASTCSAFYRNLFKKRIAHPGFNRPYVVTIVRMFEFSLPSRFQPLFRGILRLGPYSRKTKSRS